MPDEMRTRDVATATIGESGLFEFPQRTINKLWYAMYYDGEFLQNNSISRSDNNPFSFSVRLTVTDFSASKLSFFFWAGKDDDPVLENQSSLQSIGKQLVAFDYQNKKITISPYFLNNKAYSGIGFFDCFAGYFITPENPDKTNRSITFVLKRPFAQIHILTDDFMPTESDLYKDYPMGIKTYTGFGDDILTASNITSQIQLPDTWNFETGELSYSVITNYHPSLINYLDYNNSGYETTFKNRKMHYITMMHVLAPENTKNKYSKINIGVARNAAGSVAMSDCKKFISIDLPESGIKSNTKYIIYDKARSDGGTGFLDGYYDFDILVNHDGTWGEPDQDLESDRATE